MNFDDYAEMFLYFNTILPPAAVRLNRVTILGLTPSIGCRAIQLHGFVSIITTRYNRAVNDNYNGMPEAAQAKAMTRAAIDGNLTELNLGGIQQTASELALHSWVQGFKPNDDYEKMQFYYHPDHLGSSSYITNLDGEVSQHIEYVPFGEVFIEERNNTWNTPYLFNAKEFDEETGMYYYGARYYEPRLSLWMSTDPLQEKFVDASPYVYCLQNPIIILDYNGADTVFVNPWGTEAKRISSKNNVTFVHNLKAKNIQTKNLSGKSHIGWIEADMPGVINYNEGNIDLSSSKYQKYDYLIAAEVSYFNQNKNMGITPKHTNGLYINNPSSIPNLDPDIVKAIIMQETRIGTAPGRGLNNAKSDIMQANVWHSASSNDWNDSKSQFGLRKMGGATPQLSVHAGIGILYQKGLRSDGKNVYFKGWQIAIQRYNGAE
ncbi:MAG: RHS repeat-associated core domain-containing protein [Prevotella bivia]|nr:RHS repeat-associated core domain-containing protein [Prevotella bivia]